MNSGLKILTMLAGGSAIKRFRVMLLSTALFLILVLTYGVQSPVYATPISLEDLPYPFVSPDGSLNCTIVVASSSGHGPCGAAHTMDVMGAVLVGQKIGLHASTGTPAATMDDYIAVYDYETATVTLLDTSSNLIVIGGPGVNQLTWYYNNLKDEFGNRVLPVYFDKDGSGIDYIRVSSTGESYYIEYDAQGRIKADYGIVELHYDRSRFVLILSGLGGAATWAACKVFSSLEQWSLSGNAVIIKYYDSDGDGSLDTISVVKNIYSPTSVSTSWILNFSMNPLELTGIGAFCYVSPAFVASTKRQQRTVKRALIIAVLILLCAFPLYWGIPRSAHAVSLSKLTSSNFTLNDFTQPFINPDGSLNCTIVVASSSGHGPCGAAHTMDVMGAVLIGQRLGLDADGGVPSSAMDDYISSYDYDRGTLTLKDISTNLVVVGGPGVNQLTWYYNNLKDESGNRTLLAYFDKDENGIDCIYVGPTGRSYRIEYDDQQRVKADYGLLEVCYDAQRGIHVLIVAGLGGAGTWVASKVLSTYRNWNLDGAAVIVKYYDSDSDGYLDDITIVETISTERWIGIYWDAACSSEVSSIEWGIIEPGSESNVTIYIRNEGEKNITLSLDAANWTPQDAASYITLSWSYNGQQISPGEVVQVTLILSVSPTVSGITNFNFDVIITASG
ncbi:MAG: hypothetical protein ACTSUS_04135 [Candidatus Freyarchaeota archaeon]